MKIFVGAKDSGASQAAIRYTCGKRTLFLHGHDIKQGLLPAPVLRDSVLKDIDLLVLASFPAEQCKPFVTNYGNKQMSMIGMSESIDTPEIVLIVEGNRFELPDHKSFNDRVDVLSYPGCKYSEQQLIDFTSPVWPHKLNIEALESTDLMRRL